MPFGFHRDAGGAGSSPCELVAAREVGSKEGRPGGAAILVYGMYDISVLDNAPRVRIAMMTEALSRQAHTERIVGGVSAAPRPQSDGWRPAGPDASGPYT